MLCFPVSCTSLYNRKKYAVDIYVYLYSILHQGGYGCKVNIYFINCKIIKDILLSLQNKMNIDEERTIENSKGRMDVLPFWK